MNTKKALIISGGNIEYDFALCFLQEYDWDCLIAADRGLVFLKRAGVRPTHVVGDFDSAGEELAGEYEGRPDVAFCRLTPKKDDTDTHVALKLALELGCREVRILGCTGTRLDHMVAALRDLRVGLAAGADCALVDPHNRARLVRGELVIPREEQYGRYVSVFPMGAGVRGLTLEGFAYPLDQASLGGLASIGVSNEIVSEEGRIIIEEGLLMVIESKD